MSSRDLEWQEALANLAVDTEFHLGFERLVHLTRPALRKYLQMRGVTNEDREDIVQTTFLRILENRDRISFRTATEWNAYARTIARNLLIDRVGSAYARNTQPIPESTLADLDSPEDFEVQILDAEQRESYIRAANELYLGPRSREGDVYLLAAKMLLWDRRELPEVLMVLRREGFLEGEIDSATFIERVVSEQNLRWLVYSKLGLAPEILFALVLGCPPSEIPERFSTRREETLTLMLRFCNFQSRKSILQFMADILTPEEVDSILKRFESRVPLESRMRRIANRLRRHSDKGRALSDSLVWKRLAIHYVSHKMHHADFVGWVGPAASVGGFTMTDDTVRGWIGNRRIYTDLKKYIDRTGDFDAELR